MINKIFIDKREAIDTAKDHSLFTKDILHVVKLEFQEAYKIKKIPLDSTNTNEKTSCLLLAGQFDEVVWPKYSKLNSAKGLQKKTDNHQVEKSHQVRSNKKRESFR